MGDLVGTSGRFRGALSGQLGGRLSGHARGRPGLPAGSPAPVGAGPSGPLGPAGLSVAERVRGWLGGGGNPSCEFENQRIWGWWEWVLGPFWRPRWLGMFKGGLVVTFGRS